MLNIPDEVKALFKRDDIAKNFHVHFPNGEYTDLNNDDVVTESVSFTESLCSQQSFRFGLTEASELKFTAVGIPNIRGVTIEAAIEINVEELGAAWISAHAPTGTEEYLDPQVCTYSGESYYRIPLGRFIVDTCPRNHESMWKREITAYTERLDNGMLVNQFQIEFMNTMYPERDVYNPSPVALFYANIGNIDSSVLNGKYTKTALVQPYPENELDYYMGSFRTESMEEIELEFSISFGDWTEPSAAEMYSPEFLYELEWAGDDITRQSVIDEFVTLLESWNISASASGYDSLEEIAERQIEQIESSSVQPYIYEVTADNHMLVGRQGYAYIVSNPVNKTSRIICPYMNDTTFYFSKPSQMNLTNRGTGVSHTYTYPTVNFYVLRPVTSISGVLNISNTLKSKIYIDSTVIPAYSFANAFSLNDLIRGYLELECKFGSPARTGGVEITSLDNTNPISIIPSEYSSLWYDETAISPIGFAEIKFKGEDGNEQDVTVQIGNGSSVYDLTENEVLRNSVFSVTDAEAEHGVTIQDKIVNFLNSIFTPNIPDLTFVPIELEKKGLPYLEAGDAIEVETEDSQTVPSFILRQTIKGIQFLEADVESSNGEAMEMIE